MVNERELLKNLVEEVGLEELLQSQGLDPVEALFALYNCGEFDLERLVLSYDDESEDDEDSF